MQNCRRPATKHYLKQQFCRICVTYQYSFETVERVNEYLFLICGENSQNGHGILFFAIILELDWIFLNLLKNWDHFVVRYFHILWIIFCIENTSKYKVEFPNIYDTIKYTLSIYRKDSKWMEQTLRGCRTHQNKQFYS